MKLYKICDIDREVILARDILSDNNQILLSSGTLLKQEYLNRLLSLGIEEVYVKESEVTDTEQIVLLKNEIKDTFKNSIKSVIERHIYPNSSELYVLSNTADEIIVSILDEEEVIEKVYDIKERSADIYEHSISLCSLATLTGLKMNLPKEKVHDMAVACLLHDLGLRYLTFNYENQNLEELNDFEYVEYKKHPVYAYTALKNENWISETTKNIILMHHEHIDGSGYPLKAYELPIEVKIINVCDTFDEMICGVGCVRTKVYEAIEYLKIFKGVFFDAQVVDVFLRFTAVYPVGTKVMLNNKVEAVVVRQNAEFPERPVLRILDNANPLSNDNLIDLLKEHSIFIDNVID